MNELNKLIEKWCGEEGTPAFMIHALIKEVEDEKGTWLNKLLLWLASRPTCGEEQRKFLDEVEKRGEFEEIGDDIQQIIIYDEEANHDDMASVINNVSLEGIDLSKVIKGE